MRRGAGSSLIRTIVAGIVGLGTLAQAQAAYADMGFSPGFLRDSVYVGNARTGQSLLVVMAFAALISALIGIVGLQRMAAQSSESLEPGESENGPVDA